MELCSAIVRHAGNLGMTVHKDMLPPAEVVLLRAIHGHDAVIGVALTRSGAKRDNLKELERLREVYGEKIVETCFPGVSPQLPTTMAAAGLMQSEPEEADADADAPEDFNGVPVPAADRTLPAPAAAVARARAARAGSAADLVA